MFKLSKTVATIIVACIIGALAFVILTVSSCNSRQKAAQAQQDSRTATATTEAAKDAVEAVVARSDADAKVDDIVTQAAKEIDNAESPEAARAAAYNALCGMQLYADDPACRVP